MHQPQNAARDLPVARLYRYPAFITRIAILVSRVANSLLKTGEEGAMHVYVPGLSSTNYQLRTLGCVLNWQAVTQASGNAARGPAQCLLFGLLPNENTP